MPFKPNFKPHTETASPQLTAHEKFSLEELTSFDPGLLLSADDEAAACDAFVLTLALAYNDLKDCFLLANEMKRYDSGNKTFSAQRGQASGILLHLERLMLSSFNELFGAIKVNEAALEHAYVKAAEASLAPFAASRWDAIKDVALSRKMNGKATASYFGTTLQKIRSNGTFHYNQTTAIQNGFRSHFAKRVGREALAHMSLGSSLETSRFYFADAAISEAHRNIRKEDGLMIKELQNMSTDVHVGLRCFIAEYVATKQAAANRTDGLIETAGTL